MRRLTAVLVAMTSLMALQAHSQEVFSDGFENGSTCAWSSVTDGDDTQATARDLGETDDCDGTQIELLQEIHDPTDVDFTVHHMTESIGCLVNPTISVTTTDVLSFCIFFTCDSGSTQLTCPANTSDAVASSGAVGCCTTTDLQSAIEIQPYCTGTLDYSGTIWTEVATSNAASGHCAAYALALHD